MSRFNFEKVLPQGYAAMLKFSMSFKPKSITPVQHELIKIRASQINGCAFCINMHTEDALKLGENPKRIFLLNAWRESPHFTNEDRAILSVTEEVTRIEHHLSDATYESARKVLSEEQIAEVILATVIINSWNRISIASGTEAPL